MREAPSGPQRRVLFVDDEANVLSALQRMLRPLRDECQMVFARGGAEALDVLATAPFDIIVTDMRMPGIDGAELLDEVSRRHPRTARIVLSGQADAAAILRVAGPAHQYLSKPCDAGKLKATLRRVFALRHLLDDEAVASSITRLRALPVLHATLDGLQTELARESPSLSRISRIVERDIAAAAKLLQIVNSAFFGSHGAVCHAERAVHLLGADLLRRLVLSSGLLVEMDEDVARRLGGDGTWLGPGAGRAMVCAGIGRVVLACCGLDEPGMVGCTPAQAGTYLLTLWGLPDEIMTITRSEEL